MAAIYLELNGEPKGPYSPARVQQLLTEGRITADTPALYDESDDWKPVKEILAKFPPEELVLPPSPRAKSSWKSGILKYALWGFILVLVIPCCAGIALGPIAPGNRRAPESLAMQTTRTIAVAMYNYANDHNGSYPDGNSSTEVFQKLIDGKYVSDPSMFYLYGTPGKTKATMDKLTSENVCFDVTSGITANSSDDLPVVFSTGYTVNYATGASAVRNANSNTPFSGIAIAFKKNNCRFDIAAPDGSISNFIPTTFDAGSNTYRQLRP